MTTKIAQFAKDQFGIELTDAQLQYIAIVAAGNDKTVLNFGRKVGISTANKVIYAWLQDGLKSAEVPPVVMTGKFDPPKPRDRMGGF